MPFDLHVSPVYINLLEASVVWWLSYLPCKLGVVSLITAFPVFQMRLKTEVLSLYNRSC